MKYDGTIKCCYVLDLDKSLSNRILQNFENTGFSQNDCTEIKVVSAEEAIKYRGMLTDSLGLILPFHQLRNIATHYKVWKDIIKDKDNDDDLFWISESDVVFRNTFKEDFNSLMRTVPNEADIVSLCHENVTHDTTPLLYKSFTDDSPTYYNDIWMELKRNDDSSGCYIISRGKIRNLCKEIDQKGITASVNDMLQNMNNYSSIVPLTKKFYSTSHKHHFPFVIKYIIDKFYSGKHQNVYREKIFQPLFRIGILKINTLTYWILCTCMICSLSGMNIYVIQALLCLILLIDVLQGYTMQSMAVLVMVSILMKCVKF